jgi:exonuclease SbcC
MNNKSIKFLSATIRNFRGVPQELVVPLDAPLTVIHAANGTGKSTICYALEWLLTGKVEDLPNITDFACQWGEGTTSVSATCLIGGELHELTREVNSIWISENGAKRKKIKGADLLNLLTPESVSGRSAHAITKAKRGWLRNSRWLYSNSLSLLVDNSKAEERQQIFADILGLGHLTSTLRDLRDYRKLLPNTKGLNDSVSRLNTEISDLEGKLDESTPWKELAASHISKVLAKFPDVTMTNKLEENFKLAKFQLNLVKQRVQSDLAIFRFISGQWEQYHAGQNQLNILRQTLKDLLGTNQSNSNEHTKRSADLSAEEIKAADGSRSVNWAKECIDTLSNWEKDIKVPSIEAYFLLGDISESQLKQKFFELSWPTDKQDAWLRSVQYLIQNSSTVVNLARQKQDLAANIIHPPTDIVNISRLAEDAKGTRIIAESEFNALSSILDKLKTMGKEITHNHEGAHCPLCNYDWTSNDKLRKQVAGEQFITPELNDAVLKLTAAQKVEKDCLTNLNLANNQKASYDAYMARLISVDNELTSIAQQTKYLEIMNTHDFSNFNVNNLPNLLNRIQAAISLRCIFENLTKVEDTFKSPPAQQVKLRISMARENLIKYRDYYQSQFELATAEKLRLSLLVQDIMENIKAKSQEIKGVNSNVAAISQTVNSFETHWKEIVGEHDITTDALNSALAKVEAESTQLDTFTSMLAECEAVANIDLNSGQLSKLKLEKEKLSKKLEAGTSYIAEADKTIDSYSKHLKTLTSASLAPLLSPAGELFSRMHANEVYKGLSVSEGSETFKWTVFADGHEFALDAEERFSQGQRQDLALSLYLARARNTSGSFFLDEPIAHLDDLNRVAMLDIFRLVATSMPNMNLILTTASDSLARHMAQKFSSIKDKHLLNMIHLEGNPRTGVSKSISKNTTN